MTTPQQTAENLAQTLHRILPDAKIIHSTNVENLALTDAIAVLAVPPNHKIEKLDFETLLPHPRRTAAKAQFSDPASFLAYIQRHAAAEASVVWCSFNPRTFSLSFTCVLNDHQKGLAGWRSHVATFTPALSSEWDTWTKANREPMNQLEFAEFIERHEQDIAHQEGYPTSLQMLQLATEFSATSDKRIKSIVRLQGGGVRMDYVDDEDGQTLTTMKAFEKFQIGIPVFWTGAAFRIDARLKYRQASGKVTFWYELLRPDVRHEAAAKELIEQIRTGIGELPLLMGTCGA